MSKNPVVHFEMPFEDRQRMIFFYKQAFGWEMQPLGETMGDYVVAHTAETDSNNMVKTPGTINGGFYPKDSSDAKYPSVVISVEDIHMAMGAIKGAGGQVITDPVEIPGVGQYASFLDSEGNRVSILQATR